MKKKKNIQNPWVFAVIGVGLALLGSCQKTGSGDEALFSSDKGESKHPKPRHHHHKEESQATSQDMTPAARPCKKSTAHLALSADFLYWGAKQEQFAYAAKITGSTTETLKEDRRNWGPGFRIGIGGNLTYNNWDLFLNWTHWHKTHTNQVSGDIAPLLVSPVESVDYTYNNYLQATAASSRWKSNYDTVDFELGRCYAITQKIKIRPHVGLEYAQLLQNFHVDYSNVVKEGAYLTGPIYSTYRGINNFRGLGPRLGFQSRWLLGKNFGIIGNIATALLWGEIHAKATNTNSSDDRLILQDTHHAAKPMLQMMLGLDWSRCFSDKYFFRVGAAYETQLWWGQLELPTRSSIHSDGDFSLQGLTANVRFEF